MREIDYCRAINTTYGEVEASLRTNHIDIFCTNGDAETLDRADAVEVLKARRKFAANARQTSERLSISVLALSTLRLGVGVLKKDGDMVKQGMVGIGASALLFRSIPFFQRREDMAGIKQEAVEIELKR